MIEEPNLQATENAGSSSNTPVPSSEIVSLRLRQEAKRCKDREFYAQRANLISAAQAWRFRRWGIEFALKTIKQSNAGGIRCTDIVSLRRDTIDQLMFVLSSVSEIHDCDEYTGKCYSSCDACLAQRLMVEIREQANTKDKLTSAAK